MWMSLLLTIHLCSMRTTSEPAGDLPLSLSESTLLLVVLDLVQVSAGESAQESPGQESAQESVQAIRKWKTQTRHRCGGS